MQLTGAQFERIAPYLPQPSGHTKAGQRQVVDALLYLAKEGCSWRALPERFGNWHTIYVRLNRWARQGVLERVLAELQRDQIAGLDTSVLSLDSTIIKLHPDATRALALELGYQPVVPPLAHRRQPWSYDRDPYRRRNLVERFFRRLKRFRRIATRYDKLDVVFLAFINLAVIYDMLPSM